MQQPYLYAFSAPNIWKARPESPHSIYINTRSIYNAGLSDRILIKNDAHGFVREFIDYLVDVHILSAEQIMWVPNERYSLDEEIVANKYLFNTIKSHCADRNYHIVPYSTTIEFLQWYTKLHSLYPNLQVVGDDISWCKLHTKAMLHEYISAEAQNSRKEVRLGELGNLNIPHGYIANNREELVEAYKKMSRQGYKNILIKPVFTGSGMGIVRVDSMTTVLDYTFWDFGPVMLEEEIGARPSKNHQISLSIQYSRKKLYRPSIQLVDKFRWLGNMSPMIISETTINLVENIAKDIIAHTQPKGFGGFDFPGYRGPGNQEVFEIQRGHCFCRKDSVFCRMREYVRKRIDDRRY